MHQSIETPTPWAPVKSSEFGSNAPTPEARKLKISKVSRKKDMHLSGEIFQVYIYMYAALIIIIIRTIVISHSDMFVQHKAALCISLLLMTIILPYKMKDENRS